MKKKKSAKSSACPPRLSEIITDVNLVSIDQYLLDWDSAESNIRAEYLRDVNCSGNNFDRDIEILEKTKDKVFENLPEVLKRYLSTKTFFSHPSYFESVEEYEKVERKNQLYSVRFNYRKFYFDRVDLLSIVAHLEKINELGIDESGKIPVIVKHENQYHPPIFHLQMVIKAGAIDYEPVSEVTKLTHGIDYQKLRICQRPKCRKVFWAARIDSKTCSEQCFKAFKQLNARIRKKRKKQNGSL